ncbi:MAG: proline racemase, partial [Saprospiraceae bacterium]
MPNTYQKIKQKNFFTPPSHWHRIKTIDMHTGGEPLRVMIDGLPELKGNNVLEYRQCMKNDYDYFRKALMHEPRGHADMYGCILLPPNRIEMEIPPKGNFNRDDEVADFGIIFLHNEGYSTMCGHAIIAITKLAVELGWVEVTEPKTIVRIDAPCGRITAFAKIKDGKVDTVYFHGVPSFVVALDQEVDVAGLGTVQYDLAYGGAFYAYVNANTLDIDLTPENYNEIIKKGMAIKHAVMASKQKSVHPFEPDLSFLYGIIFIGGPVTEGIDSRNVCIFADGELDRCPTGSGVSGRMAIHFARKELIIGKTMTIESITGSIFKGAIVRTTPYGSYEAVIPQVEGSAYITGQHEFLIDPEDPFKQG